MIKYQQTFKKVNVGNLLNEFQSKKASQICRPVDGTIDILISYQYAAYHPVPVESIGHLLLMENIFGVILAGSHPDC